MSAEYSEFPTIIKQAKLIAYIYKWIGLYSIIFLTAVTIISMTNVFTAGEFAQWSWVKNTWAFVFAAAIDVNIVRLFVESKVEKSKTAFIIGIGLGIVTGAALFIEGLQQSIGLLWGNGIVQFVIAILVAFRVFFVIILMAREGRKLGALIQMVKVYPEQESKQSTPSIEPSEESKDKSIAPSINQPVEPISPPPIEAANHQEEPGVEEEQKPQSEQTASRRTMTINEVIQTTGLTERRVKNLIAKKVLKVSPRNASLVLISSVDEWIKVTPNSKETMEIPVVQLARNNRNGGENNGTQNHL